MSVPTFHQYFRQITGMRPLKYQKWIRLNEARRLMLSEKLEAATAAIGSDMKVLHGSVENIAVPSVLHPNGILMLIVKNYKECWALCIISHASRSKRGQDMARQNFEESSPLKQYFQVKRISCANPMYRCTENHKVNDDKTFV